MAKDAATANKKADKPEKADKPAKTEKPPKAAKPAKEEVPADAKEAKAEPEAKPVPEPRKPADPRLKVLKKFHGKFLPKGVLRERYAALMKRWDSGEDHGGVTVEELKSLLDDWKGTREKPPRLPKKV